MNTGRFILYIFGHLSPMATVKEVFISPEKYKPLESILIVQADPLSNTYDTELLVTTPKVILAVNKIFGRISAYKGTLLAVAIYISKLSSLRKCFYITFESLNKKISLTIELLFKKLNYSDESIYTVQLRYILQLE